MKKFWKYFLIAIKGKEKVFTKGSLKKAIFLLAVPMVLELIFEATFALFDAFFLSKVSANALATVGLTEAVLMLIYSIGIGLSVAATAMVARRVGEGNHEDARISAVQAIFLAVIAAVILAIPGYVFAEDILRIMGASEEVIEEGLNYTRIIYVFNGVILLLFLLNGIFRGAGDAYVAMWSLGVANVINIILDPLLIFGLGPFPEMGVTGAAIATTIGRGIGVIFQIVLLIKGKSIIKIGFEHLKLKLRIIVKLIKVASGSTGQYLIATSSWIFIVRIISIFGTDAVAGYTIAFRILIFSLLPAWGISNAASTLVGQNLGAGQADRAEKTVWLTSRYNVIFLAFVAVVYFILSRPIVLLFMDDEEVVYYAIISLRIMCLGYIAFSYGMVISQAFNGAGDTRTPTIVNLIFFWFLQIPLAYLFAVTLEYEVGGVFVAIALSESLMAIAFVWLFKKGKWKKTII